MKDALVSLAPDVNVSRETLERLECFEELLRKWTRRINLVAPSTVPDIWRRHIQDSAQILPLAGPRIQDWVDLGSGGGLPGIVIACLLRPSAPNMPVTLIEADRRKATFLQTAVRELDLNATVLPHRIEDVPPLSASIVSARALAALPRLLELVDRHLAPGGTALVQKGQGVEDELSEARRHWTFQHLSHPSITEPKARILSVKGLRRA